MTENKVPDKKAATLQMSEIIGYGLGAHCFSVPYLNFMAYMTLFLLTDVLGVPTAMAATAYSAGNIAAIVANFITGIIIESVKVKSKKLGKYSWWSIVGAIGLTVFSIACFWNFGFKNPVYTCLAYVILYGVGRIFYYMWFLAMRTMVNPMAKNGADAVALNTSTQVFGSIGRLGYGVVGMPILAFFAFTGQAYAWALGLWSVLVLIANFILVKVANKYELADKDLEERMAKSKQEKISFKDMIGAMKGKSVFFFIANLFGNIHGGFFFTLLVYYTTYVLKSPETTALAVTFVSIGGIVGSLLTPLITKLAGRRTVYVYSMILMGVLYFMTYLWGGTPFVFIVLRTVIGVVQSVAGVLIMSITNDVIDYNEMQGQSRAKAFVFSISGVMSSIGYTGSSIIASYGLAIAGYQAGVEVTATVMNKISFLMGVGPAIFCFVLRQDNN